MRLTKLTNEEALYYLMRNPADTTALASLRSNNIKLFYPIVHYWFNGHSPVIVFEAVVRHCAHTAIYFNPLVKPASQWLGERAESECHAIYLRSGSRL